MSGVVYLIEYLPWKNNTESRPWKYIGSTTQDISKYMGSVRSKKWAKFWKDETTNNPQNFEKTILIHCTSDNKEDLLYLELLIQKDYDVVKNPQFFNLQFAQKHGYFGRDVAGSLNPMFGIKRSEEWKVVHRDRQKAVLNKESTRKRMSDSQKIAQNDPILANKKQIKQREAWAKNIGNIQNSIATQYKPTTHAFRDTNIDFRNRTELYEYCANKKYPRTFAPEANHERELEIINTLSDCYGLFKTHQNNFIAYVISDKTYISDNLPSQNQNMMKKINESFYSIKHLLEELVNFQSPKIMERIGLYKEIK